MISLTNLETVGWLPALRGMRNPMRSWNKSNTYEVARNGERNITQTRDKSVNICENDLKLCNNLVKAGSSHRKFLRQIMIYVDITANLKWFSEFDTYLNVVQNSTSQMHTLTKKDFKLSDFSNELTAEKAKHHFQLTIDVLNSLRQDYLKEADVKKKKEVWRNILEIVPQSYLYTRTCMFSYEVFLSMYLQRKNHKMSEWVEFCEYLRNHLPYIDEWIKLLEDK